MLLAASPISSNRRWPRKWQDDYFQRKDKAEGGEGVETLCWKLSTEQQFPGLCGWAPRETVHTLTWYSIWAYRQQRAISVLSFSYFCKCNTFLVLNLCLLLKRKKEPGASRDIQTNIIERYFQPQPWGSSRKRSRKATVTQAPRKRSRRTQVTIQQIYRSTQDKDIDHEHYKRPEWRAYSENDNIIWRSNYQLVTWVTAMLGPQGGEYMRIITVITVNATHFAATTEHNQLNTPIQYKSVLLTTLYLRSK